MENKPEFDEVDLNRIYNALNYYCLEVGDNCLGGEKELLATKELRDYIGKILDEEPEDPGCGSDCCGTSCICHAR